MRFIAISLVIIVFSIAVLAACAGEQAPLEKKSLGYDELQRLINEKNISYILIDVRTKEEYESGHIPTAMNIPVDILSDNLPSMDKQAFIIVYCRSGSRSGMAYQSLISLGYSNVKDFGSISNWRGVVVKGAARE